MSRSCAALVWAAASDIGGTEMAINAGGGVEVQEDVGVEMLDGTILRADVYRPRTGGTHPVLLVRTPYNKLTSGITTYATAVWYASQNYMVVVQDVRGRDASDGDFYPLVNEEVDAGPTIEWARNLPGSNGIVGMYGGSYLGWVQFAAAVSRPAGLGAIAPANIAPSGHRWAWRNGAFNLAFALSWGILEVGPNIAERLGDDEALRRIARAKSNFSEVLNYQPLRDLPVLRGRALGGFPSDWMEHPDPEDSFWAHVDYSKRYAEIDVPGLHIGGWYDMFVEGTIEAYRGIQGGGGPAARGRQKLVIGPWWHNPWVRQVGAIDYGPTAVSRVDDLNVRWFDRWLKGLRNGIDEEPAVSVFVLGANRWVDGDDFPVAQPEERSFFLTSKGRANSMYGDGALVPDRPSDDPPDLYYCDPLFPNPSIGGRSCCDAGMSPMGPADQRPVEQGLTVLCYDSGVIETEMTVMGQIVVELYAASTSEDTDFVAKLVDVFPDGRAINVIEGITRSAGPDAPRAGEIACRTLSLGYTAIAFQPGHRVRLEISSSIFPFYDRTHNDGTRDVTGGPSGTRLALQTVFHDLGRPSRLRLPVIRRP
jgi:uncharacterized protein